MPQTSLARLLIIAFFCLALPPVFAQTVPAPTRADITWRCPEGFAGQELRVYNWATYIGETTLADFESLCAVNVVYTTYDSNATLIASLRTGEKAYDVAFPSDFGVSVLRIESLIQALDLALIPNVRHLDERWLGLPQDPDNRYSVPYFWGTMGIGYNLEAVGVPIHSWEQLWEYPGAVAWLGQNDTRAMLSIALLLLGYDPNSRNPDEINAAKAYLIERIGNVTHIHADDGQALLDVGEVAMVVEFDGDIQQALFDCACDSYSYAIPDEGTALNLASMVIPYNAPNPALAHAFIDYILDPTVNAMIANSIGYPTANRSAQASGLIRPLYITDYLNQLNEDTLAALYFLENVGEAEQYYAAAWEEIKAIVGQ